MIFSQETVQGFAKKLWLGEKLTYKITYLGIPVGESQAWVKEMVEWKGRKAYHVEVSVKSYRMIDWVYKVRDEHHSYIDVETLASLRYEKNIREGRRKIREIIEYDLAGKKAFYQDPGGEILHEMDLTENVQDQLSCGYWVRMLEPQPQTSVWVPVNADRKNWKMEVKFYSQEPMEIKRIGSFQALRMTPFMEFQGIFIRKGKVEGWLSLDARKIPLKMNVKIPVLGEITAELQAYEPGEE